ncbi:MAG: hypothetical protein ACKOAL_03205 [Chthoniobacterales bacterium]
MRKPSANDAVLWPRRRFIKLLGAVALAPSLGATRLFASARTSPESVLIIGDSMALCGFGEHLDKLFRDARVPTVNTYMACGTHPLSWTQLKSYVKAQSRCGFWKIESRPDGPVQMKDVYGMERGHKPSRYPVPKIEELLPATRPDVMIVQLGNNLFDLLKGKEKKRNGEVLEPFVAPFLNLVGQANPPVRRLYWVTPPICGTTPVAAQDILVERLYGFAGPAMTVIDSRDLIQYPYRHLQPDKQHFFGEDMQVWAERVYEMVQKDLGERPLDGQEALLVAGQGGASEIPDEVASKLVVECSLEKINPPFRHEEIAPYNDSLVAFVYRVHQVLKGKFNGSHIVVLHAAHIAGKRQSMHRFSLGQKRILRLRPVDETPWATLKAKDDPRFLMLDRFIPEEDHSKLALHL